MEIDKKEAEEREKNKVKPDMPNEDAIIEFDKHDENKNGQLTPQEFIKLIRSQVNTVDKDGNVIEIPEEGIIKTFKKYDTNKDISVSKEEFTAKIANIVPGQSLCINTKPQNPISKYSPWSAPQTCPCPRAFPSLIPHDATRQSRQAHFDPHVARHALGRRGRFPQRLDSLHSQPRACSRPAASYVPARIRRD
jgi:hypothetical protein